MKKHRKIYAASSWRNDYQPFVVGALREEGHEVYDFRNPTAEDRGFHWSEIDPLWLSWTPLAFVKALLHPVADRGYAKDWGAMQWADTGVLILPCGRSAHLEAGYFVGAGKPLFIYAPELPEPELMYKMADGIFTEADALIAALNAEDAK